MLYTIFEYLTLHNIYENIVLFVICVPLVKDGYDAFVALTSNVKEGRGRHVEMGARGVARAAVVIGGAEVSGGDGDGAAAEAPLGVELIVADY